MKCPDCGLVLVKTVVVGMDDSYRCGNCGGVWVKGWVINNMADKPENDIRIKKYDIRKDKKEEGQSLKCPADGSWMTVPGVETLPPDVPAWQCGKCKSWWLPGNSVFDLREAFRIKAEFIKRWRRSNPAVSLVLPVVLTLVLAVGLAAAVMVLRNQQGAIVSAGSIVIGKPVVIYTGDGKAEIRFRTAGDLQRVMIKREKDTAWSQVYVMGEGDWKVIMLDGVNVGDKIGVSIDLRAWQLTIGQQQ